MSRTYCGVLDMFELIDVEPTLNGDTSECSGARFSGLPSLEVVLENGRRIAVQPCFDRGALLALVEVLESLPQRSARRL